MAEAEEILKDSAVQKYSDLIEEGEKKYRLAGMFKNWFLDYASYVILDRAVPHIADGLKPVQRRILHAMKNINDGRYIKVATIVGETMKYHPHGDASIKEALVNMGQKNLLIDCQGNWGNTVTGDEAAAGRYIEARLSRFALEVLFNPKTTSWMKSYDGRNFEPVTLPVKFPLLLQQGTGGIAVGLTSQILPHNFNELIDASIAYLKDEEFVLYPDFPSGGLMDVSHYNDGGRGSYVKVRAKIIKKDKKTIEIVELPYGLTADKIKKSIIAANDKGKIKIKRVDDDSSKTADIVITLHNEVSPDKTIDALYKFTDCEVKISPKTCVIMDNKPHFMTVSDILRYSTDYTKELLKKELEIKLGELKEALHYLNLERIFFEQKIYKILEKDSRSWEQQLADILKALKAYEKELEQPVTMEDVNRLVEKPVRKISKFDIKECDAKIAKTQKEIAAVKKDLAHLTAFTIKYFENLKEKYGEKYPRLTEIANLEDIQATRVIISNAKLYANYEDGFIGMDLKKDEKAQFVSNCSDIDDVIVFLKNGKYIVTKIQNKSFIGKDIIHVAVFAKNDSRTVYNAIYRDGKGGNYYAKRFAVTGVTRDKEYDLTQGTLDSKVLYFTANSNGEAESVRVYLRPRPKLKKTTIIYDFASLAVKGKTSRGNLVTKNPVARIELKTKGLSTIGDKPLWFDADINRLNEDKRGRYLGKFKDDDHILAVYKNGTYCTTNYDLSNHYDGELLLIEKLHPHKTYTAIYFDAEVGKYYLKRFKIEINSNPANNFISEAEGSFLVAITDKAASQVVIQFGGKNKGRQNEIVDADSFIAEKGWKAKGKRVTPYDVEKITLIEPPVLEDDEDFEEWNEENEEGFATEETTDNEGFEAGESVDLTDEGEDDIPEDMPEDDEPTLF